MYKYAVTNMMSELAKGRFKIAWNGGHNMKSFVFMTAMGRIDIFVHQHTTEVLFMLKDSSMERPPCCTVAKIIVNKKDNYAIAAYDLINDETNIVEDNKLLSIYNQIMVLTKMKLMG